MRPSSSKTDIEHSGGIDRYDNGGGGISSNESMDHLDVFTYILVLLRLPRKGLQQCVASRLHQRVGLRVQTWTTGTGPLDHTQQIMVESKEKHPTTTDGSL